MKDFGASRWGRVTGWILLVVCAVCLAQVVGIMVVGGEWRWRGLHASHPMPRLMGAFIAWLGWYVVRHGLSQGRKEWGRFVGRVILAGFSLALGFFTAEVGLRVFLQRTQSAQSLDQLGAASSKLTQEKIRTTHPMAAIIRKSKYPNVVYELKPDVDREFGHIRLHINGAGMRKSREYAVEKPMRTVRIVGVGDSGMFGWGVHQGENYMDMLESNLNARADGKVYETLNFGVPGYNTQLEVETLKSKGLVYKPDIVVVGWCDNDFGLPFFIPQQGQWSRKDVSFLYNLMFDRKAFSDLALNQIADQRKYSKDQIPERFRAGMDITGVRNEFAELKALGEKNGFQLLVIGPMQKEVLKILSDLEIVHYNTYNRIAANEYPADYYVHAMHPRAGGHRVLAERLEREMKERGWF
jgi:lysophospholipase L1-like esterase